MSKRFLSVILAICIGLTAIAIIQIKPWQQGRSPAILSSETQDQGSLNPQPIDPAASEPSSEQEPGIAAADEAPEENPSVPTEQKTPLGQPDDVTSPVEPLLPARPGSGAVKLSTRIFTIRFETDGGSPLEAIQLREGSRLGGLPIPYRADSIFLGWFYDADLDNRVSDNHVIQSNLTLYAQYTDTAPLAESETPRAATQLDQPQNFTFVVIAPQALSIDQVKAGINGKNLNNPSETGFYEVSELTVQSQVNETQYVVSGRDGLFATGATYKFTLEDEQLRYAGYGQSVRDFNFTTEKAEVLNLSLNSGLIYISVEEISNFMVDGQASDSLSIPLATTDLGTIDFTSGSFDYDLSDLAVGQAVAIYKGVRPDERSINDESGEGEVAYITITAVQGKTCQFVNAAAQDVLFTPDILPLNRDDDQDGQPDNDSVKVEKAVLDFASGDYAVLGLDDETTVDVGDFLAFYTGTMNSPDGQATYGRILSVESDGDWYTLDFEAVSLETMRSVMDLYDNKGVSGETLLEGVDPSDLEDSVEQQARESGFAEEAATYLAALTLETEEFTTLKGDFDLAGYNIVLDDGTPLSPGDMQLMSGSKVEVEVTEIKATINKRLVHFEGLEGLRLTLKIGIEIKISTGEESEIVIGVTGYFEQEVRVSINASGGAVWKWWGIFPYIDEYRLNANIDLYEYTGIAIEATIATKEKDEELDTNDVGENLAKQIKDLLDARDKYMGDDEQTVADGLNEKYAAMLENESDWVELFSQKIFEQEGSVDPFHILVYEINLNFVITANMNISIGCDFYYENAKRYNYSIGVFQKTCTTETIDLVEEHYEFTFYVMGTMGLRAGLKFEIKVGVFSTKLASLGISAEVGAYVRVWGYFYYELSYTTSRGRQSKSSGALYFELGIYMEIAFEAQAFKGTFSYNPTLYENEWPLWSAGARENVQAFAEMEEEITEISLKKHVQTFEVPDTLFTMSYLDLKTGETGEGFYDDAKSFKIEITNEAFSYDPQTNLLKLTPDGDQSETADLVITWIQAPLVFTSEPIQRTIQLYWDNYNDGYAIVFHSRGGSAVPMILKPFNATVVAPADPVYPGYDFGGWFLDEALTRPYQIPETMPNEDVQVYAKWIPRPDTSYRVDHYQQNLSNSLYTLVESEQLTGTTDSMVQPAVKDYPGFAAPALKAITVQADGRAVQSYYYSRNRYQLTFAQGIQNDQEDWVYSLKYGESITVPQVTAAGFDFIDWGETAIPETMPAANLLYTARWSPGKNTPYRVEHYIQNTTGTGYTLQTAEYLTGETGSELTLADLGLKANGITYQTGTVNGKTVATTTIAKTGKLVIKLYYNRETYSFITFLDSSQTVEATYRFEALVSEPAIPAKTGYTFSGWYVDESMQNRASFAGLQMPAADLTLYGRMIANPDTAYQVEHYVEQTDGAFTLQKAVQQKGKTDTKVQVSGLVDESLLIPGGISFRDGRIDGKIVDELTIKGDGSVVIKLYYARSSYLLTFVLNNGEDPVKQVLPYLSAVTAPAELKKDGYVFSGWDRPLAASILNEDLTYTAQWVARTDTAYTVKHVRQNLDDTYPATGSLVEQETLTGTTLHATEATSKSYPGFTAEEIAQSEIAPDGSTVVTIRYARNRHDVIWKTDAKTMFATTAFRYGEVITAPVPAPEKQGYVLAAWAGLIAGSTLPDEDLSYTAQWQPATDTAYAVRHLREALDGTDPIEENETLAGTTASLTTAKAKSYPGFTADPVSQSVIAADGSTVITITYKRNTYTLNWLSEGVLFKTEQLKFESDVTIPDTEPVKKGYHLTGWGDVAKTMPASDISYSASFAGNSYLVTYDLNGGSGDSIEISQTFGSPYELPESDPERQGYAFTGWFTTRTSGDRIDSNKLMLTDSDQVLYAHWMAGTNTLYTVKHYQQNLTGDSYTLKDTESLNGVTDGQTMATAKTYTGFSAKPITQEAILGDGTTVISVYYTRNTYQLTFKPDNGLADQVATVRFGAAISAPTGLAKTGYVLAGWDKVLAGTMPASDLTYTAQWTARLFKISLDPTGGAPADQTLTVSYDSTYGTLLTATRTGYTFDGWFTAVTGGSQVLATDLVTITADQTLYAHWTARSYQITFDSNGGVALAVDIKTVAYGSLYGNLPVPEKVGYTCNGWFTAKTGGGQILATDTVSITENLTVYAQWTANSYRVSFAGNGATSGTMTDQTLRYNTSEKLQANSYARVGYLFAGWAASATGPVLYTDQVGVLNLTAAANATVPLYAKWTQTSYAIEFDSAGGSAVSTRTGIHYGDSISAPAAPSRVGYTFTGWFTDQALTTAMSWTTMPAQNLTLKAGWSINLYSVKYELNGGKNHLSNPASYTVTSLAVSLGSPTRTGYTFDGWYLDAAFATLAGSVAIPAGSTGDRTFHAKWTPVSYVLSYGNLFGSSHNNPVSYTIEKSFALNAPSARTGYTFAGWYETNDFSGTPVTSIAIGSTGAKSFYAKWNTLSYQITYEMNSGTNSADNPSTYTIESSDLTLADPTQTGYDFAGWYTDALYANKVSGVAIPAGSTSARTFHAKWLVIDYKIQYLTDGGTNSGNPLTYTVDTADINLQDPIRPGYTFGGWYQTSDFSDARVLTIAQGSTGPLTLYAKWSLDTYQITYFTYGATNSAANPVTYTVESATITLQNPTKGADDVFIGWYTNSTFTGDTVHEILKGSTGNLNLHAKMVNYGRFTVANNGDNTFTISRTGGTDGAQTVFYRTQNGSAISGTHFTAIDGSVQFAAGETTKKVTVTESSVTSQYSTYAATQYANADRTYSLDLVKVEGGGKLGGTTRATRTMSKNSSFEVPATMLNDYKLLASTSTAKKINEDAYGDWYKGTLYSGLSSPVLPSSVYSNNLQAYIKATATAMKVQLKNFSGYDDDWRMWRFVLFNNHANNVSFGSEKNSTSIPNLPTGTKSALVYGITADQNNRDNYAVDLPGYLGAITASNTSRSVSIADIKWASSGQDKGYYVLYDFSEMCGISVGAYNSAGADSWWWFTGGSLYASPKDTTEPAWIGVAPMASTSYAPGDTVVVSLVFNEIVNSASSVSILTPYSNSPLALKGGLGTNVLYFEGTVDNYTSSAPVKSDIVIQNQGNILDLCN